MGKGRIGERDGRISLYLAESLPRLIAAETEDAGHCAFSERAQLILEFLQAAGSVVSGDHSSRGRRRFSGRTVEALWELAWAGRITNDTFFPRPHLCCRARETARPGGCRTARVQARSIFCDGKGREREHTRLGKGAGR